MPPSRVLVTGGTGFIGRPMIAALLSQGTEVVALHRRADTSALPRHPRLVWSRADDEQAVRRRPPDAVVHLATCYGTFETPREVLATNLTFPLRLLEQAAESGCRTFLNTDTFFGKSGFDYPHMRPYIESKDQFAEAAKALATRAGAVHLRLVHCRLEHVYGPCDSTQKFVGSVLEKLLSNAPIALTSGEQERDFIHVDDVIRAYLAVLQHRQQTSASLTATIEVGTGIATSVRTFVETAKRLSGSRSALDFGALPYRDGEIMRSVADLSTSASLGWRPHYNIETGLQATFDARRKAVDCDDGTPCESGP